MRRWFVLLVVCAAFVLGAPSCTPTDPRPIGSVSGVGELVFADEFNDTAIDLNSWSPTWLAGNTGYSTPINGNESGCYHSDQATEHDGALHLVTATNTSSSCHVRNSSATAPVKSGIVTSAGKREFRYGYFEARVNTPQAANWPAWWTNGHHGDWPDAGELDIFELLSCRRAAYHAHFGPGSDALNYGQCVPSWSPGWHTYAMRWTSSRVDFFYDGVLVGGVNASIPFDHYLVLNHGVRSDYTNGMVTNLDMQVDYVRVWALT